MSAAITAAPSRAPVAAWDECRIAREQAGFLREENPGLSEDEAFARACEDGDLYEREWQCLLEALTPVLQEIAPAGRFHAEGRNMGWRRRRGCKDFIAVDARAFLRELLPDTDCTFTIGREGRTLHITNCHHDAPTGEFYTVVAAEAGEDAR